MKVSLVPTELIDGLRAWFHPKDRSVVLANSCFIEGQEMVTPGTPVAGRRRLYAKNGCWYDLGSNGTETGLCVSGVDPAGHTHSKIVASDGAPDPALSADASGYLAAAVQPLFSAYQNAAGTDITGDGTVYKVAIDTEITDRNSNFNTATYTFTAPVTGQYLFVIHPDATGFTSSHTSSYSQLVTSNRNYYGYLINPYACASAGEFEWMQVVIADMDAGDTAYMNLRVAGGTKVVDVTAGQAYSYFMGYLLA